MEFAGHAASWTNPQTSVSSPSRPPVSVLLGKIAWKIFKDDRVAHLPSVEELVPRLDIQFCCDAWFLEKPIKLKEDRFENFKGHLLEETVSKIRLLNVPVSK
jgi:hypothetical protein